MKSLMLRLFCLFLFTTPAFGETEALAGKIWDVNKQAFISFTEGLSSSTITRLKAQWWEEYEAWPKCDLKGKRYVYIWAASR